MIQQFNAIQSFENAIKYVKYNIDVTRWLEIIDKMIDEMNEGWNEFNDLKISTRNKVR